MPDHPPGLQGRPFPYDVKITHDHWWPKGLRRLWIDQNGNISRITPNGKVKSAKPPKKRAKKKGFAQDRGLHRIHFGPSPWNHTFEPEFEKIDNAGPLILKCIARQLQGEDQGVFAPSAMACTSDTLVKLCFSLMVRSPAFRYRYSHVGKSFGLGSNEETGKANVSHFWGHAKSINLKNCNSGKLLLLHSENAEFCFGDGLHDTIFSKAISWRPQGMDWVTDLTGDAFIPLLPNLCAYLYFERGGCGSLTDVLPVTSSVVAEVNSMTQIYSKEQLFFREMAPALTPEFARHEHLIVSEGHLPLTTALRARAR